jgi:hypothetical protein
VEETHNIIKYVEELIKKKTLPPNSKPVSIDFKSMYTIIPIAEGLEVFKKTRLPI